MLRTAQRVLKSKLRLFCRVSNPVIVSRLTSNSVRANPVTTRYSLLLILLVTCMSSSDALALSKSRAELEYGTILYHYYQQHYLDALVDFEYNFAIGNKPTRQGRGQVLKGGMLLSYSVPDESYRLFNDLLKKNVSTDVKNRAWYYLARLYYNKSDNRQAVASLTKIKGEVPKDIHLHYHYLATLLNIQANHLEPAQQAIDKIAEDTPFFPYLLFNLAIGYLQDGGVDKAVSNLDRVRSYNGQSEELSVLSDRAKHGLSQLSIQSGNFLSAWNYLTSIRTTGLYSNRALLTYAWSAIKLKKFNDAIPALEILNSRSISIPEVQESKVLLSHLYEQEGSPRKALKANLLAEKAFKKGVAQVKEARRIIALRDVPREFIENLDAVVRDSDWYGTRPSVNYQTLTPFLIDLMASNAFNEILKELSDLYAIRDNLRYWDKQATQHLLILKSAKSKSFSKQLKENVRRSEQLRKKMLEQNQELRLYTLTLEVKDQERFQVLLKSMNRELDVAEKNIAKLKKIKKPYQPPKNIDKVVAKRHQEIKQQLKRTKRYIAQLEPTMRKLVNAELDKHDERMRYYWAQSRLAKARLYDSTLLELEKARSTNTSSEGEDKAAVEKSK